MSNQKEKVHATFKSKDTEEWIDIYFTRPIGYLWARFFNHFGVHPNVVTILSISLGVAAGVMFYYSDLWHNLAGVLLLMWANFYDSCDGQLARMTGKKTQWGRILDGFAGDIWFFVIYVAISFRLVHQPIPLLRIEWGIWIFVLCLLSGTVCHARQSQLADYYRNIHLYFLPGVASELDSSEQQRKILVQTPRKGNLWWRIFLFFYVRYTKKQEKLTPCFQQMMAYINEYRGGKVTEAFRHEFRRRSLPLMKYANILTFNCRAIVLYAACLSNIPWLYPLFEVTVFTLLSTYMHRSHERLCKDMLKQMVDEDATAK